jgi:UDP-2,3-diacylglucosamine hydrolase
MEIKLNEKATYVNLGDWITHFTYGMFDGKKVVLRKWETS